MDTGTRRTGRHRILPAGTQAIEGVRQSAPVPLVAPAPPAGFRPYQRGADRSPAARAAMAKAGVDMLAVQRGIRQEAIVEAIESAERLATPADRRQLAA
jgi:hypothetical protein